MNFKSDSNLNNLQTRLNEIDVLKGFLIIAVVIGHFSFSFSRFVYWFHMPAFFMVSGFLFTTPDKENFGLFIKNKIIGYLVPYFFFLIALCLIFDRDILFSLRWIVGCKLTNYVFTFTYKNCMYKFFKFLNLLYTYPFYYITFRIIFPCTAKQIPIFTIYR